MCFLCVFFQKFLFYTQSEKNISDVDEKKIYLLKYTVSNIVSIKIQNTK